MPFVVRTYPKVMLSERSCYIHYTRMLLSTPLDQDIGYGPSLDTTDSGNLLEAKEDSFHPPAPPISNVAGKLEATSEVLKFDSNFLMTKPGESNEVRHVSV